MDNGGDILQLCRLCLVKDDVNIPIFEEQGDIKQIFQKISSCLPVKVNKDDKLPQKICDGCSYKLDMCYEFWNGTANAEKQLLTWLGEADISKLTDSTISAVAQQIKQAETVVKQETLDPSDIHTEENDEAKTYMFQQKFSEEEAGPSATATSNDEPPPKRARRTAAVKAQIAMDPESDEDEDSGEPLTKVEDESDESDAEDHDPSYVDVPSTSADDQPGPSGVGKDGADAPIVAGVKVEIIVCEVCDRHFETLEELNVHLSNLQIKFDCDKCQMSSVSSEKCPCSAKKCHYCEKLVDVQSNLVKTHICFHIHDFKSVKTFSCLVCFKTFSSAEELIRHCSSVAEIYLCLNCQRYFDGTDHSCPVMHRRCAFCKKNVPNVGQLHSCFHLKSRSDIALKLNEDKSDKTINCDICEESVERSKFKCHRDKHLRIYKCEFCDMGFKDLKFYYQHCALLHQDEKHTCKSCGKEFQNYESLKKHRVMVHLRKEKVICHICGVVLHSQSLKIHMQGVHSAEFPFQCERCAKSFNTIKSFTRHGLVHKNEFKHVCKTCGKGFKVPFSLKVHKRSHDEVKPFQCPVCLKTFTTKQWRDKHQNTHKA